MGFHCRVILTCVSTHVNFTRVNKKEARHEVERGSTFSIPYLTPILFVNVNFYARKEGQKLRDST